MITLFRADSEHLKIRSYYRITTKDLRVLIENRVWYGENEMQSRSEFFGSQYRLRYTVAVMRFGDSAPVRIEARFFGKILVVRHERDGAHWFESFADVSQNAVPFVPYCMGEVAWVLMRQKWKTGVQRKIPMLHLGNGNEFQFRGFLYLVEQKGIEGGLASILWRNLFLGAFGIQVESERVFIDPRTRQIVRTDNTQRNLPGYVEMIPESSFREGFPLKEPKTEFPKDWKRAPQVFFQVKTPLPLSVRSLRVPGKRWILLFDAFRIHPRGVMGTQFLRQHFSRELAEKDIHLLTFGELLANSSVGPFKRHQGQSQLDYCQLKESVCRLWKAIKKRTHAEGCVMALEENAVCCATLFSTITPCASLILVNPTWGSLSQICKPHESEDVLLLPLHSPSVSLEEACRKYPAPILVLGELPKDLGGLSHITHVASTKEELECYKPIGKSPRLWSRPVLDCIVQWIDATCQRKSAGTRTL